MCVLNYFHNCGRWCLRFCGSETKYKHRQYLIKNKAVCQWLSQVTVSSLFNIEEDFALAISFLFSTTISTLTAKSITNDVLWHLSCSYVFDLNCIESQRLVTEVQVLSDCKTSVNIRKLFILQTKPPKKDGMNNSCVGFFKHVINQTAMNKPQTCSVAHSDLLFSTYWDSLDVWIFITAGLLVFNQESTLANENVH